MHRNKRPFAEIYAWNEPVLSAVAVMWGLYVGSYSMGFGSANTLTVIAVVVLLFGLLLAIVQSSRVRTVLDFTLVTRIARLSPVCLRRYVVKIWPVSIIIRVVCHFFFCWWWGLSAVAVMWGAYTIADSRFALYIGFSFLHFDRLVRIIQWMRK